MFSVSNIRNYLIFGLIGFSATAVQIVFLREFFKVFNGNELSLGIVLAAWLLWTACGSYITGKLPIRFKNNLYYIIVLQILTAAVAPLIIVLIRAIPVFFNSVPGEIFALSPMIVCSFVLLSVFGLISGGLFTIAVSLIANKNTRSQAVGRVYLVESLGSAVAGIFLSLILIPHFNNLYICFITTGINLIAAGILAAGIYQKKYKIVIITLSVSTISAVLFFAPLIQAESEQLPWQTFSLIDSYNSEFGNYEIIQTGGSKTIYLNGSVLFTIPNQAAAEENVHFAMLQHPKPAHILLFGGGLNGSIEEILKHPSVTKIDYVETDDTIFEIAEQHFPVAWNNISDNPKVNCIAGDGRLFLRASEKKYDVILLLKPDPQTAQMNRFFTREFFALVIKRLKANGIFSFQAQGSENYINEEMAVYLSSHYRTLNTISNNVLIFPGDVVHYFTSPQAGNLTEDAELLINRMDERALATQYINRHLLTFRLSADRMDYINEVIIKETDYRINTDFHPAAYFFSIVLWSTQFSPYFTNLFGLIDNINSNVILIWIILLFTIFPSFIVLLKKSIRYQITGALSVLCLGFTVLGAELLLLLLFQTFNGYVYEEMAVLIAAFMSGMSAGSWLSLRNKSENIKQSLKKLFIAHFLLAVILVLTPVFLKIFNLWINTSVKSILFSLSFFIISLITGGLGGYIFPLAGSIFYQSKRQNNGMLYSLDLIGSMFGAILISTYLIPLHGIYTTSILLSITIFLPVLILVLLFLKLK